jgi:nucleoprotein TPR
MKNELKAASDSASTKQNILDEVAKDLENTREDFRRKIGDLNVKIDSLTTELEISRRDKEASEKLKECAYEEMQVYKDEAVSAKDNYERELAMHAEARKELQSIRTKLDEETASHHHTKDKLQELEKRWDSQKSEWEDTISRMEESNKNSEHRLEEAKKQIEVLHSHISRLSQSLEKAHAEQRSLSSGNEQETLSIDESVTRLEKEVFDLRQVISFQQNEKRLIEDQLDSARRAAERERAAADVAKRSLRDLRSELEIQQNKPNDVSDSSSMDTSLLQTKLQQAEEQLVLLRESNKMLRQETEELKKTTEALTHETNAAKGVIEPINKRCMVLEVEKSALEAEKESLMREVDAWRDRVQGLLKKFNQVSVF